MVDNVSICSLVTSGCDIVIETCLSRILEHPQMVPNTMHIQGRLPVHQCRRLRMSDLGCSLEENLRVVGEADED